MMGKELHDKEHNTPVLSVAVCIMILQRSNSHVLQDVARNTPAWMPEDTLIPTNGRGCPMNKTALFHWQKGK